MSKWHRKAPEAVDTDQLARDVSALEKKVVALPEPGTWASYSHDQLLSMKRANPKKYEALLTKTFGGDHG